MSPSPPHYVRPDLAHFKVETAHCRRELALAGTVEQARGALLRWDGVRKGVEGARALVDLHHRLNTGDGRWAAEQDWFDAQHPVLLQHLAALGDEVLVNFQTGPLRAHWGGAVFHRLEAAARAYHPDAHRLLAEEAGLRTRFRRRFIAAAWPGVAQQPALESPDRATRKRAYRAGLTSFKQEAPAFASLYRELVDVRRRLAGKAGFTDPLAWSRAARARSCPGREGIQQLTVDVAGRLVPLATEMLRIRAFYLETDDTRVLTHDEPVFSTKGTPRPPADGDAALALIADATGTAGLSRQAVEGLRPPQCQDLEGRPGKDPRVRVVRCGPESPPFLTASWSGTCSNFLDLVRAAGQAVAMELRLADAPPLDSGSPPPELSRFPGLAFPVVLLPALREALEGGELLEQMLVYQLVVAVLEGLALYRFEELAYATPLDEPLHVRGCWIAALEAFCPWRLGQAGSELDWIVGRLPFEAPGAALDQVLSALLALDLWARHREGDSAAVAPLFQQICRSAGRSSWAALIATTDAVADPFTGESIGEDLVERSLRAPFGELVEYVDRLR